MTPHSDGLRLIFAGTPVFAAHHLQALIDSHHQVIAVYTQPDRPAGRGKHLSASPVKELALTHGISVYQPASLKEGAAQKQLAELQADAMVVVAYGLLLPKAVLEIPRFGCFNVHGSLLPRWRGAAPIQRAVAAGDKTSGVTIMQMDVGLDTGDMLHTSECSIASDETSGSLHDKLMALGPPALLQTLSDLQQGELKPIEQDDEQATYAEKISKAEALIDWTLSASDIDTCIRAYNPFPVSYTFINGKRIKIFSAEVSDSPDGSGLKNNLQAGEIQAFDAGGLVVACGSGSLNTGSLNNGSLNIKTLQLPGKKIMAVEELLNGYQDLFAVGQILGDQCLGDQSLGDQSLGEQGFGKQ